MSGTRVFRGWDPKQDPWLVPEVALVALLCMMIIW